MREVIIDTVRITFISKLLVKNNIGYLPSETQFIDLSILLIVVDQRKDCNNTHGAENETNNTIHNADPHVVRQVVLLHAKFAIITCIKLTKA